MKIKDIPLYIPKNIEDKIRVAKILENYFINFINKTQLDIIDGILEFCDKYNIRIEDIDDYFEHMDLIKTLANNKKVKSNLF